MYLEGLPKHDENKIPGNGIFRYQTRITVKISCQIVVRGEKNSFSTKMVCYSF